jgi:hypothetical protein
MTAESYKGYQIESGRRGGIFQISKSGKHMATGNSLVDARLMIDLHENHLTSPQLPVSKERVIADAAINR